MTNPMTVPTNVRTEAASPISNLTSVDGVSIIGEREASVVDSRGRLINVKRLSAVQRMNMFRIAGAESSSNANWMSYAVMAASVTRLADDPVPFPASVAQIEAIVTRLDDEGLTAVGKALMALTPAEDLSGDARNL